jgi:AcrR family transcriptional regulator
VDGSSRIWIVASVNRRAQADATRARIIAHAYELFSQNGYRATTMQLVADGADVAVQTVYFTFRTKDDLLRSVFEWTVLGEDGRPPQLQDWHVEASAAPDANHAIPLLVAGIATINARMAPLLPVFHAVTLDPVGEIYAQSEQRRRADMGDLALVLSRKTPLRAGVTRHRAADLLFVLTGPALYRDFVLEAGWTPTEWVRWVSSSLIRDLFKDS